MKQNHAEKASFFDRLGWKEAFFCWQIISLSNFYYLCKTKW